MLCAGLVFCGFGNSLVNSILGGACSKMPSGCCCRAWIDKRKISFSTASKAGSECGSVEVLHNHKFEDGVIKLADLVDQFKSATDLNGDQKLPTSMSSAATTTTSPSFMTRTSSTPALNQLRQHMMTESVNHFMNFVDACVEDSSIVGINLAADSKIDL